MTIDEAIKLGAEKLRAGQVPDPRREASLLLGFCLGKDRAYLISHNSDELSKNQIEQYFSLLARREKREPFHYVTGEKEFYGLAFKVDPSVLIPRPETEMLVEEAINFLKPLASPNFCEIGVGSGCIAVSVLHQVENATAIAVDISEAALNIARQNARKHSVADRLILSRSDVFASIPIQEFDLIVSNPPYVPSDEIAGLESDVRDFEPHSALTDGGSGLSIIERIIHEAPQYLRSGGKILLEIGSGQAENVAEFFSNDLWRDVDVKPDLRSIPRVISAVRN